MCMANETMNLMFEILVLSIAMIQNSVPVTEGWNMGESWEGVKVSCLKLYSWP